MGRDPNLQHKLDTVLNYAEELVNSTRDEVMGLRREKTCEELFEELRKALMSMAPEAEHKLKCATLGAPVPLEGFVATEIFYVLREAVWNSAKHANAKHIRVSLQFHDGAIEGIVSDDGVGLPAGAGSASESRHWGIAGMRERIHHLHGELTVENGERNGVVVRFSIPCSNPDAVTSSTTSSTGHERKGTLEGKEYRTSAIAS